MIKDITWNCGTALNNESFVVNCDLDCSNPVETCLYSKLIDKYGGDVICYNCGDIGDILVTKKYIKLKKDFSTVRPTYGIKYCKKDKKQKWKTAYDRKATAPFKYRKL